ncbi:MAG: alpha-2-macroglobulin [Vicinamibacteria bacterium]|nr:alpha-2-macroglobulin [Vicinamibacteria bacterium]
MKRDAADRRHPATSALAQRRSGDALLVSSLFFVLSVAAFDATPRSAHAGETPRVVRPANTTGTVVIPDRFLRRWDPITIFFTHDLGPAKGGPEDDPGRFAKLTPRHPGAYEWLDARTLQFRPAEPWPALTQFAVKAHETSAALSTLMPSPEKTLPENGGENLPAVSEITLTFPDPLDRQSLALMTSIELRPLPGVGGGPARTLTARDFEVKAIERGRRDSASYALVLREPIPLGTRVLVRLRLSLDDDEEKPFHEIAFATAEPFRIVGFGCRAKRHPVAPEGTRYAREQAIDCGEGRRAVVVEFSAIPKYIDPVQARNLVRFTPAVENLSFTLEGKLLEVAGDFARDALYGVRLTPAAITDRDGRRLDMSGASEVFVHFPRQTPYVRLGASHGIVERFGPQMAPVQGRGHERVDLRLYKIDPLDRAFWPFPDEPVILDESRRPPGPGEEPDRPSPTAPPPSSAQIAGHISALGSPAVSTLLTLPLKRDGGGASFGLDLEPHIARVSGRGKSGAYLVGLRDLSGGGRRSWMRVQVTDLSLSTIEEARAVRFAVTSLSSGRPIAGARVRVEGVFWESGGDEDWRVFAEGTTDAEGLFRWPAPGARERQSWTVRRIVVQSGEDMLVLDPSRPPERYHDNQFSRDHATWLQWAFDPLESRGPQAEYPCHIYTERPVYRPEEEVHIKGYLRRREGGRLAPLGMPGWLIVAGPGDLSWKYAVTVGKNGSFYHKFRESDLPTGTYRAHLENENRDRRFGRVSFRIEAYRIPLFEVALHGPDRAKLDASFEVSLTAAYYAGGRVGGRPVHWRVTQFPHDWTPKKREGFVYSSDGRFSRVARFESTPRLEKDDMTDEAGESKIVLDPTIEPNAQPRSYVVEATVTGPDDQTVTATRNIPALPPFVLGVKAPRFIERAKEIAPAVIVVDAQGEPIAGQRMTVRLLRREWHSHLRASDFSDGVARYLTDVVDVKIQEKTATSAATPTIVSFPIDKAGVYLIEVESRDRLDRAQMVSVDLYAGGDEPIAWQKPATQVFSAVTDRPRYDPGGTAAIVLKSPFQTARALAVVEAPEGNIYEWIAVNGGAATFHLPIRGTYTPRIATHFILMRGRLSGTTPIPGNKTDLGRPATMAATVWLDVNPVDNRAVVTLDHPSTARPGQKIDVGVALKDPHGRPLSGEVTLWLVDQAVLALGKEQRLDPLPDFITKARSHVSSHDTRGLVFGALPFAEHPGGDEGVEEESLLDRTTVRKNFKSVPYYNPAIAVGPDGRAVVSIELSDDLTNFKLRAKAACGADRFGFATGHLPVRLPVIVQPALPRFVRPGDSFTAAAIGRVVEGASGPGTAEMRAEGVKLDGPARKTLIFASGKPERIEFPVAVETPSYAADGRLSRTRVAFRMAVARDSDGARDAFEVSLPIRDDRERVTLRVMKDLTAGARLDLPSVTEPARPGTLKRSILVSGQPALVRMAAGLDFLLEYPYDCTEQQVSRARAYVALRKFRDLLVQSGNEKEADRAAREVIEWIPTVVDQDGLVAYWPGASGYVSLTAWVVQFLVEAKDSGIAVDEKLFERLTRALEQALRSDYGRFIDGEAYVERAWALSALAQAGRFDAAYAAELARRSEHLDLEGAAQVLQAFARARQSGSVADRLARSIVDGVVFRLHQGREIYGGLQAQGATRSKLILPSETRTVAEIARALARHEPRHARLPILTQALVTLGRDDGWGTTNANAAALLALAEQLAPTFAGSAEQIVHVEHNGKNETISLGPKAPMGRVFLTDAGAARVSLPPGAPGPIVARVETSYVPAADGSHAESRSNGFVVMRELLRIRGENEPPARIALGAPGETHRFTIGEIVEDHVQVVNPKERHYVAVVVPLAAGMEPLNPRLATAPPESRPTGRLTRPPTYAAYLDDHVAFYYDTLPAGTYDFHFRTRAAISGRFVQPAAKTEMMYDGAVFGNSNGARIVIAPEEKR